jgi:iron complex transport system substrate-binding protein
MQKTVFDHLSRKVTFNYPPKRIVSLVPSISELIVDLGLENELVGITKYCVHPSNLLKSKTIVGGTENIDIELITSLNPDIIIANREENNKSDIAKINDYPVFVSYIKTFDEALSFITDIGHLTNKEKQSHDIVNKIIQGFKNLDSNKSNNKAAYIIWKEPFITVNNNTFTHSMLEKAGFDNVFSDLKEAYPKITKEDILQANPDYILLASEPYPFNNKHVDEYSLLFKNSKILPVDGEIFSWYGSHLIKAPQYFKQLL